ncbi:isochorismatase family protein [Vibrio mimicus]|uniref:isochorismatase family protein n=1 Tax=Vibrio mimicus TaxID=674 RepID=UPI002F91DBEB
MSIPELISYDIGKVNSEKSNIVKWELDYSRSILLIHDMQEYFLRGFSKETREKLIENCQYLLNKSRENNIPVIYTAQCGDMTKSQRGLLKDFWGSGMSSSVENTKIVSPLEPNIGDFVSPKWRYSAFSKTNLIEKMRDIGRDQIILCGVYAHIGIQATAVDAYSNDIEVFLIRDAIADFTSEHHSMALDYMVQCCAKNVSIEDLIWS